MFFMVLRVILVAAMVFPAALIRATEPQWIDEVLYLKPVTTGQPAFPRSRFFSEIKASLAGRLERDGLPQIGQKLSIFGRSYGWQQQLLADRNDMFPNKDGLHVVSVNLRAQAFTSGSFVVTWRGGADLFLDGEALEGSPEKGFKAQLVTGTHRLLLMLTGNKTQASEFRLGWEAKEAAQPPRFYITPQRWTSARQLYESPKVTSMAVAPDGRHMVFSMKHYDVARSQWRDFVEMRHVPSGRVLQRWQKAPPVSFKWSPDGKYFAYLLGGELWLESSDGEDSRRLLDDVPFADEYFWAADSSSLFFHWNRPAEAPGKGVKRYRALEDRWSEWRDRHQVFQLDTGSGWVRQLTEGGDSHSLVSVHPQGKRLLLLQVPVSYDTATFENYVLRELNLATGSLETLFALPTYLQAKYGHGGIYVLAGPSAFDRLGAVTAEGRLDNEYDIQLYFYDLDKKKAICLSKSFDPSLVKLNILDEDRLLLLVNVGDRQKMFTYAKRSAAFRMIEGTVSFVEDVVISGDAPAQVFFSGTSANLPQRVYRLKVDQQRVEPFFEATGKQYDQTRFGKVNAWSFKNRQGREIDGRYYLPPDFDETRKYPLIVYYYGGVVPVTSQFTGRYPFNLWAANGYVVYVPQPAGAVGYGQEFSAKHANAWGRHTADDILDGVSAFVAAHRFIDPAKMGCMGASYGGFMTMYLVSHDDRFAAAISHAGISALSGYWGEGWWGFSYSAVANRGSFPWNRSDLYTEQSPLFRADRIHTPLLLLHGAADTNVPPGQSHNMYTALKLLRRDVELITFDGEDHHILEHDHRLIWWDTILAWFDKKLKNEPAWWSSLYPEAENKTKTAP